jgi:large subunit ribosomal protein L30
MSKKATTKAATKNINITLVRSLSKRLPNHKANAKGLGLKKMNQTVSISDTPEHRGMINRIAYLLKVEE